MKNKQFTLEEQEVFEQVIKSRRDVRGNYFIDREVSEEVIEKILSAAISAPSVGYSQPWEFVVIRDREIKHKVTQSFVVENDKAKSKFKEKQVQYASFKLEGIKEAPVNIAVFYKPSTEPVLGQTSMPKMGEYSVVCAVQNMWLMARALNVGIGWVSILDPQNIKKILQAPEENQLIAYLCVGYVTEFMDKPELETLEWADKKNQNSLVIYNSYSDFN